MNELMHAIAQSDFFYRWVAPNIEAVQVLFFVMLFLMAGLLAEYAREADRDEWWEEVRKQDAELERGREA